MMKYPKAYLDEIKLRLKVSQVVGKSVQLKKRGKEFIGLSPFKNEKSPSFTVSDEKEFYHCFSTGEHGNIFDFLMKTKSIGFGEAVKTLAAEAGMAPYRFSNFDEKKEKRFQIYKNIFKDYKDNAKNELFDNSNRLSLEYLKKRGLTKNIIDNFELGYVSWKNNFYEKLIKKYSEEEINLTGLYYKSEKSGKFIDRFNSRIIFPINNLTGDTIAFGGRIIKESKLAKYINSPETEFYKKGRMLFNLDKAKAMRSETEEIIIVEGYMDVVSLFSAGIKNVISNSGTALTGTQIELIWKFFNSPIICLDGDESGQKAALRIAERLFPLIKENNKIYFSILKEGDDPDDFIKKNGKEKFLEFLKDKKIIQSYLWLLYSHQLDTNDPYAISKFEKKIKQLCYSIQDETLRKYILEEFLEKIRNLTPIQNSQKIYKNFNKFGKRNFKVLSETKILHNQKNHLTKEQLKEYSILFLMLNFPNIAQSKIEDLSDIEFSDELNKNFKKHLLKYLTENLETAEMKTILSKDFGDLIEEINKNNNLGGIMFKKDKKQLGDLLDELIADLKEMNQLKKIEFLEGKFAENLDENSYSELIKLKRQLNGE